MTEEEKGLAGYLYKADEPDIEKRRAYSVELSFRYNALDYLLQQRERDEMIHTEMRHAGIHCDIKGPFFCDFWERVTIGDYFCANYNFTILAGNEVFIGDHVLIGPNVGIHAAGHAVDLALRDIDMEYARPVHIGNHVWIGGGVNIVSGVSIGDGSIIGAGSVVVHDIPAGVLAAGNPCRVIRTLSPEDDRKYLMPGEEKTDILAKWGAGGTENASDLEERTIRKFGQVGLLKEDQVETYKKLHQETIHEPAWQGVQEMIRACHLKNYSIFLSGSQVFAYFEYTGTGYEADMKRMEQDPLTQKWWQLTHPCFKMVKEQYYTDMEQIFELDGMPLPRHSV